MAAQNSTPEEVRIQDLKRLDSSLTLKHNRPQLEAVIKELQKVVRNEELLTGLVVRIPLDSDRNLHELTVSHSTRQGVSPEKQAKNLYWSDYAAILLDLAQKFKKTSLRDEFAQYGPTKSHLEQWVAAPNTARDIVDELTVWQNRYELAELAAKLVGAFAVGTIVETETDETSDSETPAETEDSTKKLSAEEAEAIANALVPGSDTVEATASEAGGDTATTANTTSATEPVLQPGQEIDSTRPLTEQLSAEQRRQYGISVGWMTSFTLLQIADSMGVNIQDLDPALRAQLTDYATQYLEREGDIATLLAGSPSARLKAIRGLNRLLREKNFFEQNQLRVTSDANSARSDAILEKQVHDILKETNPIIDKNIEKTIDSIVVVHGEKAATIISSFDKQKIELIFGLEAYSLSSQQIDALKNTLLSYVEVRLAELTLHTQNEKTKDGLVGDAPLDPKNSLELIGSVRNTIVTHSSKNDGKGELVADAVTTTENRTGQKIKFALEQNEKIFGNYWRSLKPEEQAIALAALGAGYLIKGDQHPVGGYDLPINISELDPSIFKKYEQILIAEQRLLQEIQLEELTIAREMNEYVVALQRAEILSYNLRAEYIAQTQITLNQQILAQQSIDDQSLQEYVSNEQGLQQQDFQPTTSKLSKGLNKLAEKTGASKVVKGAKDKAKQQMHKAANAALGKAAGFVPVVGTALMAGNEALAKVIGRENANKLYMIAGGILGGATAALIIKTIQALQTIGGAIGGVLGGAAGFVLSGFNPAGALAGGIAGAHAGAAAQNWVLNLFGKGAATTGGGAGFSSSAFGTGSLFSGSGSTAGSALPTIAQGSNAIIQGTGNAVQAVTNLGQQAAGVSTTAAASVPAVSGLKAAVATTGTFLTSLPVVAVGFGTLFPGFMTFVVFIVIMGAFLVPMPFTVSKGTPTVSKYATVVKTPTPSEIDNNQEVNITYDIRISPKPGYSLQIKRVTDEFLILGGSATVPDSPVTIEAFPQEKFSTIQTTEYTLPISGEDALVINTVTFVVDVYDGSGKLLLQGESIAALGLLIIGDPPIGCFDFAPAGLHTKYTSNGSEVINTSLEWTQDDIVKFLRAFINRVGTNPQFLTLVCADGNISLHKWNSHPNGYWGWKVSNTQIGFYGDFFNGSPSSMEYTVVHELGHIIDGRNSSLQPAFKAIQTDPIPPDSGCFTYPFPAKCSEGEAFAEAIADYVVWQTHSFNNNGWNGMFPFKTRYPVEYAWVQMNIFGGIEY